MLFNDTVSDIANFRMNIFVLDASFFPHSDIMTGYDNVFLCRKIVGLAS